MRQWRSLQPSKKTYSFRAFCIYLVYPLREVFYSILFITCTNPIIHPSYPQEICIGIAFDFSWDIFMSQEKLQLQYDDAKIFGDKRVVL